MQFIRGWCCAWLCCAVAGVTAAAPTANAAVDEVAGVVELPLQSLYENPIGPLGLKPTPELQRLAGHRVRITGYMVEEQEPLPGQFKLTLLPVKLAEREDGPADDLPAATVVVHLSAVNAHRMVKFDSHAMAVTGTLELGPLEEPDGRISHVRLLLDPDNSTEPSHAR